MLREVEDQGDLVTEEAIIYDLASRITRRGEQGVVAADLGISQGHLSNLLTKGRGLSDRVAGQLGYRRVFFFERVG